MGYFVLNLAATLMVIMINALANILPLNGQTTGEISNKLNVIFTPAGYVFSIWGLIYSLLLIWTLRQFPRDRKVMPIQDRKITPLYVLSSCLNVLWIILWHHEYFFSTVIVMIALLITLIALYERLKERKSSFWDMIPFSVYLGWICVATIANISYFLVYIDWDGFGLADTTWTLIMLIVAAILAVSFSTKHRDVIFPLVFVWAFIGIGVQNAEPYPLISNIAYTLTVIIFLVSILANIFRKKLHSA